MAVRKETPARKQAWPAGSLLRVAALIAFATGPAAAAWVRVASPRIEVFTDAEEKTGRQLLGRFELIHAIFHQANIADSPLPVRVFVFASEKEFRGYRDAADGFYQSGPERDYIVMHAGTDAARVAFHEYVHLVLNHSALPLPKWFEEGTAEFYSTLELDRDRLSVGKPIESHLERLSTGEWLPGEQLASVTAISPLYTEPERVGIFYSESWALVHMLNLAPAWRDGMPHFVLLLAGGQTPEQAFQNAFGRTMDQAVSGLGAYLRAMRSVSIPLESSPARNDQTSMEPVNAIRATLLRADLAMQTGRRELARSLFERAAREMPESPETAAGLGALALAENRKDDARRQIERAIALGSRDASTYFEYAMLERDTGAKRERVDQLLENVIAINSNFAEAHFLLGVHATDDGRYPAAVAWLQQAVRILPRQSYFWHALGYAQWKLGRSEEGLQSARRALATATNEHELKMAQALANMGANKAKVKEPVPPRQRREVITPPSWQNRKGDSRIEGVLTRVDCEGASAKLEITALDGSTATLAVHDPSKVELVNAPQSTREFSCGPQRLRVVVEYVAAMGEVTRIEFRPLSEPQLL